MDESISPMMEDSVEVARTVLQERISERKFFSCRLW